MADPGPGQGTLRGESVPQNETSRGAEGVKKHHILGGFFVLYYRHHPNRWPIIKTLLAPCSQLARAQFGYPSNRDEPPPSSCSV
jgi:hypothetical protein